MGNSRQYALIAFLAELEGKSGRLGKKAAQKLMHILSSVSGGQSGYRFSFYTYGAFSSALASDLDIASSLGLIKISYEPSENSYSITAGKGAAEYIRKHVPQADLNYVSSVWKDFSGKSAKELELLSTVLFLYDEEHLGAMSEEMSNRVLELKPKYTLPEVRGAQRFLSNLYGLD